MPPLAERLRRSWLRVPRVTKANTRWLCDRTGLPEDRCRAWCDGLENRLGRERRWLVWAGGLGAIAWVVLIFGPINPLGWLYDIIPDEVLYGTPLRRAISGIGGLLVIFGPVLIVPMAFGSWWRRASRRELRRCLSRPACFVCGHDCQGVPAESGEQTVRCPECGERTPVNPLANP